VCHVFTKEYQKLAEHKQEDSSMPMHSSKKKASDLDEKTEKNVHCQTRIRGTKNDYMKIDNMKKENIKKEREK
jgi:hypothetical protein